MLALLAATCAHGAPSDDPVEAYLRERELGPILEAYLEDRVDTAPPGERDDRIAALAELYLRNLQSVESDQERQRLLDKMEALLAQTGSSEAYDLRIGLAVEQYDAAERAAEAVHLGLDPPMPRAETIEALGELARTFAAIGSQLERDVLYLERRARAASEGGAGDLARARRQRSLAKYYAAWANTHLALLTDKPVSAHRALDQFAWTLDTPGQTPTLERLPASLLELEHVARAAVGVGIAFHATRDREQALAWLTRIRESDAVADAVRDFAHTRTVLVLVRLGAWSDASRAIESHQSLGVARKPDAPRLLAVGALRAIESGGPSPAAARRAASFAIATLAAEGHTDHVVDLAGSFDVADLLGPGFLRSYLRARAAQAEAADGDQGALERAADRYARALRADDASAFASLHADARFNLGRCLFEVGRYQQAVEAFEQAEAAAVSPDEAERALWMRLVALEQAAGSTIDPAGPIPPLARRYMREHPDAPNTVALAARLLGANAITPDDALPLLVTADERDPAGRRALHTAAGILADRASRETSGTTERDRFFILALRLYPYPEPVLNVALARRALRLALDRVPPDLAGADAALGALHAMERADPSATSPHASEIAYRDAQVRIARGQTDSLDPLLDAMDSRHRTFAAVALLSSPAAQTQFSDARVAETARLVLSSEEPGLTSAHRAWASKLASAASARLWHATGDTAHRDFAIELDERALETGAISNERARRLAGLAVSAGRESLALEAWLLLLAAAEPGSDSWFEARLESLELKRSLDAEGARAVAQQFAALYPSLGPDTYRDRFRALLNELGVSAPESQELGGRTP